MRVVHIIRSVFALAILAVAAWQTGCAESHSDSEGWIDASVLSQHRRLADQLASTFGGAERLRVAVGPTGRPARPMFEGDLRNLAAEVEEAAALAAELRQHPLPGERYGIDEGLRQTRDYLREAERLLVGAETATERPGADLAQILPVLDHAKDALRNAGVHHDSLRGFITDPGLRFEPFSLVWPQREWETDRRAAIQGIQRMLGDGYGPDRLGSWQAEALWTGDLVDRSIRALDATVPLWRNPAGDQRAAVRSRYVLAREQLGRLQAELASADPDPDVARSEAQAVLATLTDGDAAFPVDAVW